MKLQKELVIGLDMQHLHHYCCDLTDGGWMFLHQGNDIIIYSIGAAVNITNLKIISIVHITAHCIAIIPNKLTNKFIATASCILKVEMDEMITIQNPQLVMLPMVHLKDEVQQALVPLTRKSVTCCDTKH